MGAVRGALHAGADCVSASHKDADLRFLVKNKISEVTEKGIWLKAVWVKAGTTDKEKAEMSSGNGQIASANDKADELAKSGAELDGAIFAQQVARDARDRRQEIHAATRNAAEFHCKDEDITDTEEITEGMKLKPRRQFGFKDKEGMRHRIATAKVGRNCQCMRCSKRQIFPKFLCECIHLMWVHFSCIKEPDAKSR